MAAGITGDAEAATSGLRRCLDGGDFQGHGICPRWRQRHPVRHLCHDGAEPDHERGKNKYVTHHAKLDQRNANITTPAAKPRPMAAAKVAILAKRMTEVLTGARYLSCPGGSHRTRHNSCRHARESGHPVRREIQRM